MKRAHLAIVGFGPLGHACALALLDAGDLELAGVVRRSGGALPAPLHRAALCAHLRDLKQVDAALLCVPPDAALGVQREIRLSRRRCAASGLTEIKYCAARRRMVYVSAPGRVARAAAPDLIIFRNQHGPLCKLLCRSHFAIFRVPMRSRRVFATRRQNSRNSIRAS